MSKLFLVVCGMLLFATQFAGAQTQTLKMSVNNGAWSECQVLKPMSYLIHGQCGEDGCADEGEAWTAQLECANGFKLKATYVSKMERVEQANPTGKETCYQGECTPDYSYTYSFKPVTQDSLKGSATNGGAVYADMAPVCGLFSRNAPKGSTPCKALQSTGFCTGLARILDDQGIFQESRLCFSLP
ncbi:MAG: hypothetical protein IT289_12530 [Oligoflexia bacterium]|nr:hypothetical protein [Oligoflexia bacterium]